MVKKENTNKKTNNTLSHASGELPAINAILALGRDTKLTNEEMLQQAANLIHDGLQHANKTYVRVVVDEKEFTSPGFAETKRKNVCKFSINNKQDGLIEVYYPAKAYGNGNAQDLQFLNAAGNCLSLLIANKYLEGDLDRSRNLFSWLPRKINDIFFVTGLDGEILFVSNSITAITGRDVSEYIGCLATRFTVNEEVAAAAQALTFISQGKSIHGLHIKVLRKDGTIATCSINAEPLYKNGKIMGGCGTIRDLAQERKFVQSLYLTEERYHFLAEHVKDTIWTMDMDGRYTYISPNVKLMRGYTVEEAMSQKVSETLTPSSYATVIESFKQVMAMPDQRLADGVDSRTLELEQYCKDGSTMWTEVKMAFLRNSEGKPTGIVGVTRDIEKRKQAENRLIESEKKYRGLYDSIHAGMIAIGPEGTITDANRSALDMLGYSMDELWQTHFHKLVTQDWHSKERVICQQLKSDGFTAEYEVEFIRKDGTKFPASFAVWLTEESEMTRNWAIIRDISRRKQSEEQLKALSHRLVNTQEEERRRISRELHDEIGQIMTTLKLSLEIAERSPEKDCRERIHEAQLIVSDLMVRTRGLIVDLWPSILDNLGLIPALSWYIQNYTRQTGIKVDFTYKNLVEQFPTEIQITAYRIVQEALTNVARHAGNTSVSVNLEITRNMLNLRITDAGKGFDMSTVLTRGPSIGLTGIRERAELLGGTFQIKSAEGQGTSIDVGLPFSHLIPGGYNGDNYFGPGRRPSRRTARTQDPS